jgi:serine/threonine protein kinase
MIHDPHDHVPREARPSPSSLSPTTASYAIAGDVLPVSGDVLTRSPNNDLNNYIQKHAESQTTSRQRFSQHQYLTLYDKSNNFKGMIPDDVKVIQSLGYGAFSKVEEIWHVATNVRLARKTVRSSKEAGNRHLALEAAVLRQLRHRHIVRLIGTFAQSGEMSIFLSPVAETNLAEYLATCRAGASESRLHIRGFFGCLVSAIHHTHESSFTHGDIKPTNILVSKDRIPNVLLCDFGASRSQFDIKLALGGSRPFTRRYCAPEAVNCARRGRRADVFSLGCVFLEMAATLWLSSVDQLSLFRDAFRNKIYYQEIPQVLLWLAKMGERASTWERRTLRTISKMMSEAPRDRPTSSELSLLFPPRACCEAWPSTEIVTISSFEALYALSSVKYRLETVKLGSNHYPSSTSGVSSLKSLSPALSSELIIAESLLDLSMQRNRTPPDMSKKFSLISSWLKICVSTHSECVCNYRPSWLPSRLIDVGQMGDLRPRIRLIVTSEEKRECSRYIALSHVWGDCGEEDTRLTVSSLPRLRRFISPRALPAAVENAITITRQLGERYLWVDSLCIIQDSQDDWQQQTAAMAAIYRNAFVTVAVTCPRVADLNDLPSLCPFDTRSSPSTHPENRNATKLRNVTSTGKLFGDYDTNPPLFFGRSARLLE